MNLHDIQIPKVVESEFFDSPIKSVRKLTGGLLNISYSVELEDGRKFVLQKIKPATKTEKYDNYHAVHDHLRGLGWSAPDMTVPASHKTDVVYTQDNGDRWVSFVQLTNSGWNGDSAAIGDLLGKLHRDLKKLDYTPKGEPMISTDMSGYVDHLREVKGDLPTEEAKRLTNEILQLYTESGHLPEAKSQLIHADCKIDNILHDDGAPYTFIGWKTLMQGNLWFDIGDMMRSIAKTTFVRAGKVDCGGLEQFMKAYYEVNNLGLEYEEFQANAMISVKHITVVLAIRYAADYKDGDEGYFGWDSANYSSRFENNQAKAAQLKTIYEEINQCTTN